MKAFNHHNANSVDEALALLRDYEGRARLIAGGTDLLGLLKDDIFLDYPEALINIKTISGPRSRASMSSLKKLQNLPARRNFRIWAPSAGIYARTIDAGIIDILTRWAGAFYVTVRENTHALPSREITATMPLWG